MPIPPLRGPLGSHQSRESPQTGDKNTSFIIVGLIQPLNLLVKFQSH